MSRDLCEALHAACCTYVDAQSSLLANRLAMEYRKHYKPLESDPEVFNKLIHSLGVSKSVSFVDIWSLDQSQLEFTTRPVLAVVLLFPTNENYEKLRLDREASEGNKPFEQTADESKIFWFKQTINNACGLYAMLHAVSNAARSQIEPDSSLDSLLERCRSLKPDECALLIEDSKELEKAHSRAAEENAPKDLNAQGEVDFHYVCFTLSEDGGLLELDGDRSGPCVVPMSISVEDVLDGPALEYIRGYVSRAASHGDGFSLMGLIQVD